MNPSPRETLQLRRGVSEELELSLSKGVHRLAVGFGGHGHGLVHRTVLVCRQQTWEIEHAKLSHCLFACGEEIIANHDRIACKYGTSSNSWVIVQACWEFIVSNDINDRGTWQSTIELAIHRVVPQSRCLLLRRQKLHMARCAGRQKQNADRPVGSFSKRTSCQL